MTGGRARARRARARRRANVARPAGGHTAQERAAARTRGRGERGKHLEHLAQLRVAERFQVVKDGRKESAEARKQRGVAPREQEQRLAGRGAGWTVASGLGHGAWQLSAEVRRAQPAGNTQRGPPPAPRPPPAAGQSPGGHAAPEGRGRWRRGGRQPEPRNACVTRMSHAQMHPPCPAAQRACSTSWRCSVLSTATKSARYKRPAAARTGASRARDHAAASAVSGCHSSWTTACGARERGTQLSRRTPLP